MITEIVKLPRTRKNNKDPLTDELIDKCIDVYLQSGNMAAVGRSIGRSRAWIGQMFKKPYVVERMKTRTSAIAKDNPNVANTEECLAKLTSIMRGKQMQEAIRRVEEICRDKNSDAYVVSESIKHLAKSTPQIESNQIKATTMLLTAQGALNPGNPNNEDNNSLIEEVAIAMIKARVGQAVIEKLKEGQVIDVTPES